MRTLALIHGNLPWLLGFFAVKTCISWLPRMVALMAARRRQARRR